MFKCWYWDSLYRITIVNIPQKVIQENIHEFKAPIKYTPKIAGYMLAILDDCTVQCMCTRAFGTDLMSGEPLYTPIIILYAFAHVWILLSFQFYSKRFVRMDWSIQESVAKCLGLDSLQSPPRKYVHWLESEWTKSWRLLRPYVGSGQL